MTERFKINWDGLHVDIEFLGNGISLHRDEAERLGGALLDAVQASHNADPPPPVHKVSSKKYILGDYPKDGNIEVVNDKGEPVCSVYRKVPRIIR